MNSRVKEIIELVCYAIGLTVVGYINTKSAYIAFIVLVIIYSIIKNYLYNKR